MKARFWKDAEGNAFITKGNITLPAQEYNEKYLNEDRLLAEHQALIKEKEALEAQLIYLQQLQDQISKMLLGD